jgi:integrase
MHAVDAHTAAMEAKADKQSRRRAEKSKTFKLALQFYLLTGSREDEGCHIRPSRDLDLERMILRIPMPKTRTQKVIPIESELESVIRQLLDRADGRDQLINIPADSLYHTFKKFAAAARLDPKFTFHSLRHTAASWLAAEGVGFRQVQDFLGHADAQSTQIYIHSLGDELRSQIGKLRLPREKPAAEGEREMKKEQERK